MRRVAVVALAVVALLGVLSPPVLAQAPTPKVTINGLVDNVTFASKNFSQEDRDFSRSSDRNWVARTRGVFTIWGEIGKAKAALALEFDAGWGNTDTPNNPTSASHGPAQIAFLNNEFGQNDDTNFLPEVKWLFVEFPMPWSLAPTTVRVGGQSDRWTYKPSVVVYTDSPGISIQTDWSPGLKSRFGFFQYNERNTGRTNQRRGNENVFPRGDSYALEANLEVSPFKGLDVMPLYVYWEQGPIGTQSGSGSLGWDPGRGGVAVGNFPNSTTGNCGQPNAGTTPGLGATSPADASAQAAHNCHEYRHYIGLDAMFKAGVFFLNPTAIYQWGKRDIFDPNGTKFTQNQRGFLLDLEGGVTLGPLTVPVMFIYSGGNSAKTNIGNRVGKPSDVNYYQSIYIDAGFGAGRISEILAQNSIDYVKGYALSTSGQMGGTIGYDRYGRMDVGVRPKYALTPAITVAALAASHWTAEGVDTNGAFASNAGIVPGPNNLQRTRRYLGSELAGFLTYAFLPGLTFDYGLGIFFTGEAFERCRTNERTVTAAQVAAFAAVGCVAGATSGTAVVEGGRTKPEDAYWTAARLRYQF